MLYQICRDCNYPGKLIASKNKKRDCITCSQAKQNEEDTYTVNLGGLNKVSI